MEQELIAQEPITERQRLLLEWISDYIADNKYPPTLREISDGLGYRSPAPVQDILGRLHKKGYVTWTPGKSRTIQVLMSSDNIPSY